VATGMELPFTIPLKGIDLIVKAAPHFPECTFTIAGCPEHFHPPLTANNIKWVSIQSKAHLLSLYQNHQYYLQLSMSEGFPNAICEAMLCECIPIGSDVNALPDIIGDTGFMIHHRDAEELKSLIHLILKSGTKKPGFEARHRIIRNFSLTNRKEKLLKLADRLIQHENKT
jgi:glycosyltransferase involved in cell wall biosynthesis